MSFTIAFFITFALSDIANRQEIGVRPGNVLVAVRNPSRLQHLQSVLRKTDTRKLDIVVLSVRAVNQAAFGEQSLEDNRIFSDGETNVFTHVVTLAEKAEAVRMAARPQSPRIAMWLSPKLTASGQGAQVGDFWEQLRAPRPSLSLEIVLDNINQTVFLNLGPHPPRLRLELNAKELCAKLHHRDVIGVALRGINAELHSDLASDVPADVQREVTNGQGSALPPTAQPSS